MAYGLKISKENKDVKTAVEKDLIVTSNKENLSVKLGGGGNYSYPSYSNTTGPVILSKTYNHNLGYIPFVLAFAERSDIDGKRMIPFDYYFTNTSAESQEEDWCQVLINENQLTIQYYYYNYNNGTYSGGGYNVTFTFYVFANSFSPSPLPRVSSEGPWLDLVYSDITFGVNISKPSPTPGSILDVVYGDITLGD